MDLAFAAAAALFAAVTFALVRSRHKRFYKIVFMVRTKWGLRLIDALAGASPRFWKFMGDVGVVASFSGLGALYLSRTRESSRNLKYIAIMLGLAAAALADASVTAKFAAAVALTVAITLAFRRNNSLINFFLTSLLVSAIAGAFIPKWQYTLLLGFLGVPAVIMAALGQQAYSILQGSMLPGVSPLLPSTKDGSLGVGFPGYDIFIPWWYAVIAIALTLIPHEMAHGVMSRAHHVKLDSTGLITIGAMPIGAFVEPDESKLKSKPGISRMRMYSAGSMANFAVGILAALALASMALALDYVVIKDGVTVVGFDEGYPAAKTLALGVIIRRINNNTVSDIQSFKESVKNVKAGDTVTLETDSRVYSITAASSPADENRGYMGVSVRDNIRLKQGTPAWVLNPSALNFAFNALSWIAFFAINIGLVNLMPLPPFDGYRMVEEIVKTTTKSEETFRRVIYGLILLTSTLFVLNLLPLVRMLLSPVLDFIGL